MPRYQLDFKVTIESDSAELLLTLEHVLNIKPMAFLTIASSVACLVDTELWATVRKFSTDVHSVDINWDDIEEDVT